jgi:hypothetical protein
VILTPKFEKLHQTLTEELGSLPAWKQDALRRDEPYINQRRPELCRAAQSEVKHVRSNP